MVWQILDVLFQIFAVIGTACVFLTIIVVGLLGARP